MKTSPLIGVIGGRGGVDASTFVAALASVAGRGVLIDLDVLGGGIDVLLGIEHEPGARWSRVRIEGGRLDPVVLANGLPHWRGVSVLAADGPIPASSSVVEVLDAAALLGPVVVDIGRWLSDTHVAVAARCDLVIVIVIADADADADADVGGLAGARAVVSALGEVPVGVVTRRGSVPGVEAGVLTGVPRLGELPAITCRRGSGRGRLPRSSMRVAAGVLDGLAG